jgi:hypothetical protein
MRTVRLSSEEVEEEADDDNDGHDCDEEGEEKKNKKKRASWKMEEMPERILGYCRIPTVLTTIFVFLQDKHICPKQKRIFLYEQLILYYKLS